MCLVGLAIGVVPHIPLLVAANRDEYWSRPTRPLDRWQGLHQAIISGRDERAGGTWMGFSQSGLVAILTNVRGHGDETPAPQSRGLLTTRWLDAPICDSPIHVSPHRITQAFDPSDFAGFNLVVGHAPNQQWWFVSNRCITTGAALAQWHVQALEPGVHVVSNASLNTPWPKADDLRCALQHVAQQGAQDRKRLVGTLWHHLQDSPSGRNDWQDLEHDTFVWRPQARYGTRSSTIATWGAHNQVLDVQEWTYEPVTRQVALHQQKKWHRWGHSFV
jgi:uncharacterized protein with NRDE domain